MDPRRLAGPGGRLRGEDLQSLDPVDAGALAKDRFTAEALKGLPDDVADLIRNEAPTAIEGLVAGRQPAFRDRFVLEAVARVDGRPALPLVNGFPDLNQPEAKGWNDDLDGYQAAIAAVSAAVGRIDLAGVHVGTGFLVAPNLVLTNRHVAEIIAKAFRRPAGGDVWLLKAGTPWIDFARELGSKTTRRFRIVGVAAAGPEAINLEVNPRRLDAALLQIEAKSLEGEVQAAPLTLLDPAALENEDGGNVMSIGYPGTPGYEPKGPVPTDDERKLMAALKRIFNMTYGVKRLSPGEIVTLPGRVQDGGRKWAFTHDASTLAGASGSCVVRLSGGQVRVVGLHFGGAWLEHNFAHLTARIRDQILTDPAITWQTF